MSETYKDIMLAYAKKPTVIEHKYRINRAKGGEQIHIFVEGYEDAQFYWPVIRLFLKQGISLFDYNCKGRSGVIKAHELVSTEHSKGNCLCYFTDKDYDEFLNLRAPAPKEIYQTSFYSFENYLVSSTILEKCLCELLHQEKGSEVISRTSALFQISYQAFVNIFLDVTSVLIAIKKSGANAPANNLETRNLIALDDWLNPTLKAKFGNQSIIETLSAFWPEAEKVTAPEYLKIKQQLRTIPPKKWLRGKWEFDYFVIFLTAIQSTIRSIGLNAGIQINSANGVHLIAPRLDSFPECLQAYVRERVANASLART